MGKEGVGEEGLLEGGYWLLGGEIWRRLMLREDGPSISHREGRIATDTT